jgi:protein tyrosine phosphatase (PTP) superfamily phosphohydrolase (DUF442 family)
MMNAGLTPIMEACMLFRLSRVIAIACLTFIGASPAGAQQITKETVPGVTNFARLETTVACGGATKPEAVPELKKMGFASIINLRVPTEAGAMVEEEAAAAKSAGIKYFSLPFNGQSPDPAVADKFVSTITSPGNEPAYIHCASGNRAASMWLIKRLVVDRWDTDRAVTEATALGLTNPVLRQFALDYSQTHKR